MVAETQSEEMAKEEVVMVAAEMVVGDLRLAEEGSSEVVMGLEEGAVVELVLAGLCCHRRTIHLPLLQL